MSSFISMFPGHRHMRSFFEQVNHDPGTVAVLAAVSTGIQVVGAISSAQAQSASLKSQAQAADANAKILRDNAAQVSREASAQEDQLRTRQRIARGAQVAGVAQAGIGFEGTGGDLIEQSDINATLDDLSVRYEGEMKSRNLTTQAGFADYDAASLRANASAAKTAGYLSAFGAAASGASSYAQYQAKYGSTSGAGTSNSLSPSYGSTGPGLGRLY